jgi:hypothetical protein
MKEKYNHTSTFAGGYDKILVTLDSYSLWIGGSRKKSRLDLKNDETIQQGLECQYVDGIPYKYVAVPSQLGRPVASVSVYKYLLA